MARFLSETIGAMDISVIQAPMKKNSAVIRCITRASCSADLWLLYRLPAVAQTRPGMRGRRGLSVLGRKSTAGPRNIGNRAESKGDITRAHPPYADAR